MDSIGDICRICLSIGANVALFDNSNVTQLLFEKLIYCTGLNVYLSDDLPKMLCCVCTEQLENCYKFKQRAVATDSYLQSKFSAIKEELSLVRSDCQNELFSDITYPSTESLPLLPNLQFVDSLIKPEEQPSISKNEDKLDEIKMKLKTKLGIKKFTTPEFSDPVYYSGEMYNHMFDNLRKDSKTGNTVSVEGAKNGKQRPFRNNYICDECGSHFETVKKFLGHLKIQHDKKLCHKPKRHMCDICGKIFYDNHGLQKHKLCHSGIKPFLCRVCSISFSQQANMERHVLAKHAKDKQFHCGQCDSKFAYKSTLKEHLRCHHGGERKYLCGTCGKRFSKRFSMKRHTLTHTNQRQYMCQLCDKAYSQGYDLKLHMKRMHTAFL